MLKRTFLLSAVIFTLSASLCFGWVESFRSVSSGNLFYGDFDNDLDPIYIWDNDGYRLYSTLSNLSSSTDRFISNANNGVYLFGTSGNFKIPEVAGWKSRSMLVVELADYRDDDSTSLDTDWNGFSDIFGQGYLSGNWVINYDDDDDGAFDRKLNISTSSDNFDLLKRRDWAFVHCYKRDDIRIGLSISHRGFGNNYSENNRSSGLFNNTMPTHNFSYSYNMVETTEPASDVTVIETETGNFKSTSNAPANIFNLAIEAPFYLIPNSELRFDIIYEKRTDESKIDDSYYRFSDDQSFPDSADWTRRTESVIVDSVQNGSIFTPQIRLTKHWNKKTYSWFDLSYGFGSFDANMVFADRYDFRSETGNLSDTAVSTRDYDYLISQSGETKHRNFGIYHKTAVNFTENFTFSAGMRYNLISYKTDWVADSSRIIRRVFDNGDGVDDASDTTLYSLTSSIKFNLVDETKYKIFNLPVAMEYSYKRWTFRFGAEHTIFKTTNTQNYNVTEATQTQRIITLGDGTSDTTYYDDEYLSTGESTESKTSSTNFVYGLEFRANDHLKVELLQYMASANTDILNTDFYRQFRISLTVLF